MALSIPIATDKVLRLFTLRGLPPPKPEDIESALNQAAGELPAKVAGTPRSTRLQKEFTLITLTSDVASLTSKTDMATDYISRVVHSDGNIISLLPVSASPTDLTFERSPIYPYWGVLYADSIRTKQYDGITAVPDGTLTVTALFTPTIGASSSTIPVELEDDYIEAVFEIAARMRAAA